MIPFEKGWGGGGVHPDWLRGGQDPGLWRPGWRFYFTPRHLACLTSH